MGGEILQLDEGPHEIATFARWDQDQLSFVSKGNCLWRGGQKFNPVVGGNVDINALLALVKDKSSSQPAKCGMAGHPAHKCGSVGIEKGFLLVKIGGDIGDIGAGGFGRILYLLWQQSLRN